MADEDPILICQATKGFPRPREEIYGFTSQMRREAVSVGSDIVEGCACESEAESLRFLEIALGSSRELHSQAGLSACLGYLGEQKLVEAGKGLGALLRSMRPDCKRLDTKSL